MTPGELTTRARLELRRLISPYPGIFVPLMRRRSIHAGHVVDPDTEIMIEGAPRSGNTFAVAAFELAQGRPVSMARHLHGAGHVLAGVARGVPVLVVCRNPEDSVTSQVIRHPETTLGQALRQWITFHEPLLDHLDEFVVARFEEVTSDFGAIIERVNDRFGTAFASFAHTEKNVADVFAKIDEMDRKDTGKRAPQPEATTARPTDSREIVKKRLGAQLGSPELRSALERAVETYRTFLGVNAESDRK